MKSSPDSKSAVRVSTKAIPKRKSTESNKSSFANQDASKASFVGRDQKATTLQKSQACKTMYLNASQASV